MVLKGETGEVVWEKCGHHLMLGRTERSGIDDCVNPSLQHQKANTPGWSPPALLWPCPQISSRQVQSLSVLIDEDGMEVNLYFDGLAE